MCEHTIDGSGDACVGVLVSGSADDSSTVRSNVTVCNGTLKNFSQSDDCRDQFANAGAVVFVGTADSTIKDLKVLSTRNGVFVNQSTNVKVYNCVSNKNRVNGFVFLNTTNIVAQALCASDNAVVGYQFVAVSQVVIERCIGANNFDSFLLLDSTAVSMSQCTASNGSRYGIACRDCSQLTIEQCKAHGNADVGMLFLAVTKAAIQQCAVDSNDGEAGLAFDSACTQYLLSRCSINFNRRIGLLGDGTCATVADNTVSNNEFAGIVNFTTENGLYYGNRSVLNGLLQYFQVPSLDIDLATTPYQNVERVKTTPPPLVRVASAPSEVTQTITSLPWHELRNTIESRF